MGIFVSPKIIRSRNVTEWFTSTGLQNELLLYAYIFAVALSNWQLRSLGLSYRVLTGLIFARSFLEVAPPIFIQLSILFALCRCLLYCVICLHCPFCRCASLSEQPKQMYLHFYCCDASLAITFAGAFPWPNIGPRVLGICLHRSHCNCWPRMLS